MTVQIPSSASLLTNSDGRTSRPWFTFFENLSSTVNSIITTGDVISVFGRAGIVVAETGDYTASQITNIPTSPITATNVQDALNQVAALEGLLSVTDITGDDNIYYPLFVSSNGTSIVPNINSSSFQLYNGSGGPDLVIGNLEVSSQNGITMDGANLHLSTNGGFAIRVDASPFEIMGGEEIRFYNNSSTQYTAIQAQGALAANYTLTLPSDAGSTGDALITDGVGNLSWSAVPFGDFITQLTGDVTAIGPGSVPATVVQINGNPLGDTIANSGNLLIGDGTSWVSNSMTGDISITNTGATTISANAVTDSKFRQSAGYSVVGNTGAAIADVADISGISGQVLVINDSGLVFGSVDLSNSTSITNTLSVSNGGTGTTTLTQHGVLIGQGTSAITALSPGSLGQLLRCGGSTANPSWTSSSFPSTSNQGDIIYASALNTYINLAKSSASTRYLSNQGTSNNPSWSQVNLSNGVSGTLPRTLIATDSAHTFVFNDNTTGALVSYPIPTIGNFLGYVDTNTIGQISLVGTSNQVSISPSLSVDILTLNFGISASYAGQSSITTLGTIATGIWNALPITTQYGGTNITSYTLGDILYASSPSVLSKLAGNTTTTTYVLSQTGTGSVSAAPSWINPATNLTAFNATNLFVNSGVSADSNTPILWLAPSGSLGSYNAIYGSANFSYNDNTNTLFSPSVSTTGTLINTQSIGTTSTDGLILQNTTTATAGNQQYSPRLRFTGQGWKTNATAASQTTDTIIELEPIQQAANPSFNLVFKGQINGGGYTSLLTLPSGGGLNLNSGTYQIGGTQIAASNLSNGTTGSGSIVLATSPVLTTPNLGTPSTLVGTNITGTASSLTAGNATNVAITNTSSPGRCNIAFINGNSGNLGVNVDDLNLNYNPSTATFRLGNNNTGTATQNLTTSIGVNNAFGSVSTGVVNKFFAGAFNGGEVGLVCNGSAAAHNGIPANSQGIYCQDKDFSVTTNGGLGSSYTSRLKITNDATGNITVQTGNLIINTAGKTLQIKQGSNACSGTGAVLVAGTVTVSTTAVATGDIILLSCTAAGGTQGIPRISAISNGVSFTITSSSGSDTSTYSWVIIKAA